MANESSLSEHQAARQRELFQLLLQTSIGLLSGRTRDEVLRLILQGVQQTGFDRARLFLLTPDGLRLEGVAQVGMAEQRFTGISWPVAGDYHFQELLRLQPAPQIFKPEPAHPDPWAELFDKHDVEEWACFPLLLNGHLIGQLVADNKFSRRPIEPTELVPLALFAMQAAAAIEKANLSEQLHLKAEQLEQKATQLEALRLATLNLTAASIDERQGLLSQMVASAVRLLHAHSAGLYRYLPEREELELVATHNRPGQGTDIRPFDRGLIRHLGQSGNLLCMLPALQTDAPGPVLEVVLRWQGAVVGVLCVDGAAGREFTLAEVRLLNLFAEQAAVVLAHYSLNARDENKLELFAKLTAATTEIVGQIGKQSLRELLELVARHVSAILAAEVCSVFLCKDATHLTLEAGHGYLDGTFEYGLRLPIESDGGPGGFTRYIARTGALINLSGAALRQHPAIRTHENHFSRAGRCLSVLALPLKLEHKPSSKLVGLLRADNKLDASGQAHERQAFTEEDESILRIFGEIITVCLESAKLVEHQQLLLKNLPQALIAIDLHGNVTEFNQEAERILGYQLNDILGKKVSQLYFDPEEPKAIGAALAAHTTGRLSDYYTLIRTKDGQPVPIRLSAYWLYEHQQRSGSVGIFEDLRQLKDMTQRLELTLHAIRTVAEAETLRDGLQELAKLLVARFNGALCGVFLANDNGTVLQEQAAAYGTQPVPTLMASRQIRLADFPGLSDLLQAGKPFRLRAESANPLTRLYMQKLNVQQGFDVPLQSLLVLPLKLGDRLLGVLDLAELCADAQSHFSKEHPENTALAAAIATQSALFIDRMQTAERARQQLLAFYEVSSKLLLKRGKPRKLLNKLVNETRKAAGAVSVDLVLIDQEGRPAQPVSVPDRALERPLTVRPEGISMKVFRSGKAQCFPDVSKARDQLNPQLVEDYQAAICLPLALPQRRIGVLWLRYDHSHRFTEPEVVALQLYVNQAAVAYENAREAVRQKQITRAAKALASATEIAQVRAEVLASARTLLKADAVIFGYFDSEKNQFLGFFSDAKGIDQQLWEKYRSLQTAPESTAYRLLSLGPLFIGHLRDSLEGQLLGQITREFLAEAGFVSLWTVPLEAQGKSLGLVAALYRQARSFDEREWLSATSLSRYAGLALYKASLLEQVQRANAAAAAVTKITVLGQRKATLASLIEEVRKVTVGEVIMLFEYDQEKKQLLPPLSWGLRHPERTLANDPQSPLVTRLLKLTAPIKVEEVTQDEVFSGRSFARAEAIQSLIAVPLRVARQPVGVLFVNYRQQRHFTSEEMETLQLLANQAALAIHYAQTTEASQRQLQEMMALDRLSGLLRRAQSLQEMMDCATALAAQELGVEFCNIVLPNRKGKLELRAQFGWVPPLPAFELEFGDKSQAGYMIQTGKPVVVADYDQETRFPIFHHLREHKVKSSVAVPMFRDEEIVGALLAFTTRQRNFTDEEVRFLGLIADRTALALRSAERHEALQRRNQHLRAVYNASRQVLELLGDEQGLLDRIVKEAVESVTGVTHPKAVYGTLQVYDAERHELVMRSMHPPESRMLLDKYLVNGRWSLDRAKAAAQGLRIGVTGRTIEKGVAQLVSDLDQDPDYLRYNEKSKSELSVPLCLVPGQSPIGTINVESDQLDGFDQDDLVALQALADHAAIAIHFARTYRELRETQGLVGARTALAWMGMANNAWRHTIVGEAAELANRVTMLRELLDRAGVKDQQVLNYLTRIEQLTSSIREKPITLPLSSEQGVTPFNLNGLVKERVQQLHHDNRYEGVQLLCALQPGLPVIQASSEWLRRVLDILVDNAAQVVRELVAPAHRRVTVSTHLCGADVALRVTDTGPGIEQEVLDKLFTSKVDSAKGQGVGLLMAQAIVAAYGGKISARNLATGGAEFSLRFPKHL